MCASDVLMLAWIAIMVPSPTLSTDVFTLLSGLPCQVHAGPFVHQGSGPHAEGEAGAAVSSAGGREQDSHVPAHSGGTEVVTWCDGATYLVL